ncbi:MAG: MFS transporter [Limibaculum sp.]
MSERWRVLALLFLIRTTMAFQFGSVGALGPLVGQVFQVDAADVGLLIGLYLSPGIVIALPGGAIGRFFGDKRAVLAGLALMTLGGAVMTFGATWEAQIVGRVLAGVGGLVLNVLMTKMVTDWFAGREIATAMAIFINSWPVGIAIALVAQPFVAAAGGISGAFGLTAALAALGFAALLMFYRQPPGGASAGGGFPRGAELTALLIAATIWGLYNAALSMIFGFGPILLTGRGWELVAASSATSLAIFVLAVTVPLGGYIADRTGRFGPTIVIGMGLAAATLVALPRFDAAVTVLILFGIVAGPPAGAIMSLPARVLAPETRALGMGIFYTLFYAFVVIAPLIAGALLDWTGWDGAAMDLGAAMMLLGIGLLALFERVARRATAAVRAVQ